jgi:O-antigen ligase
MVVAFLSVLVTAIALGAWDPGGRSGPVRFVRDSLSHRRLELWHESLRLIGHTPLFGVGISRFDDASPVARSDPDTSHAHNEFLELSAEAGIVAGLLLVSLVVWLILRTTDSEWPTAAIVAGVACAAAAIHACIDFVFHAPAVPLAAAYLSGAAIGRRVDEAIR